MMFQINSHWVVIQALHKGDRFCRLVCLMWCKLWRFSGRRRRRASVMLSGRAWQPSRIGSSSAWSRTCDAARSALTTGTCRPRYGATHPSTRQLLTAFQGTECPSLPLCKQLPVLDLLQGGREFPLKCYASNPLVQGADGIRARHQQVAKKSRSDFTF